MLEATRRYLTQIEHLAERNVFEVQWGENEVCSIDWMKGIDSASGWYFIYTDAPIQAFLECTKPDDGSEIGLRHNLPRRVRQTKWASQLQMHIAENQEEYCVYNGESDDLRKRVIKHYRGGAGTGCISFSSYELLRRYRWWVKIAYATDVLPDVVGGDREAVVRVALEQAWRVEHGWPLLCLDLHKPRNDV